MNASFTVNGRSYAMLGAAILAACAVKGTVKRGHRVVWTWTPEATIAHVLVGSPFSSPPGGT